jgi:hypothetical protein
MMNLHELLYFERIVLPGSDSGEVVLTFEKSRRVNLHFVDGRERKVFFLMLHGIFTNRITAEEEKYI